MVEKKLLIFDLHTFSSVYKQIKGYKLLIPNIRCKSMLTFILF